MDDGRVGRVARGLRHTRGLRQLDVAARAECSQDEVSLLERGRIARMPLWRLRKLFAVFDADVVVLIRWRGGSLDRLLDERHAALAGATTRLLESRAWVVAPEVTYSIFGERGSIDLLSWHPGSRTLLVIELKTEITSVEATLRQHDVKVRLAPGIARERFGWDPQVVGRLLVLPESRTARRQVERHRSVFVRLYPMGNVDVRRGLTTPGGRIDGVLFLTDTSVIRTARRIQARRG